MSDTPWGEEESAPKKKSVPVWVWFCGGGCLLAVLAVAALSLLAVDYIKDASDPEIVWPKLEKLLPYDERPPELTMFFGLDMSMAGQQQFTMTDSRGFMAQIIYLKGKQGNGMRSAMFDAEEPSIPGNVGMLDLSDMEKGTVNVQGRDLRIVRMTMAPGKMMKMIPGVDEEDMDDAGHIVYIDLLEGTVDGNFWLQYTRTGQGGRITDEEIRDFFEPFHVGPDR